MTAKHPVDPRSALAVPAVNERRDLACLEPGVNPNWFFSNSQLARPVCERCPAKEACLAFAVATEQRHGMWGGVTAEERAEMLTGSPS